VLIAKIFFKSKIIQHLHGAEFLNFYGKSFAFRKFFIYITQKKIDYSIVLGANLKYIFRKWNKLENIFSVPNGIQSQIKYKEKDSKSKTPVLFFFGNLLKFKGLMLVLEILELIKKEYPEIKLNIAGNWGYDWYYRLPQKEIKEEFYKLVKEKNLGDNLNFIGPVYGKEKIELLENSDILIYPTQMDGFPIVLLEAMEAGCPVITTKLVGAIPEIVVNGETGFLISNYSTEKYAEAIKKLLEDPLLFKSMSLNSRKRYKEKYTLDINIKNIVTVFENVLNGREKK
jgi:glycosyltransferase involved in cell wall biosynthesis